MSKIGKVGSALKRAALYIPRKIIRSYRNNTMGTRPNPNWPTHDQKLYFGEPILGFPKKPRSIKELLKRARKAIKKNWAMGPSTWRAAIKEGLINWTRKK
jgi:hypothetical protein